MSVLADLRRALEPPLADDELRIIAIPAPAPAGPAGTAGTAGVEGLLDLEPGRPAVFWSGGDDGTWAGLGAAALVRASGPERMPATTTAANALFRRVRTVATGGAAPVPGRLFGGFSFLPDSPPAPWDEFGDAAFLLPRLLYVHDGLGPRLAVVATADAVRGDGVDALVRSAAAVLDALAAPADDAAGTLELEPDGVADGAFSPDGSSADGALAEWEVVVASIRELIEAGRADKVVAARVSDLRFRSPPRVGAIVRRLSATPAETRFAFRPGRATFVGATPERLVSRRGRTVRSDALAGTLSARSARPGIHDDLPSRLRSSGKDVAEHAFVVRAIADVLGPLCQRLDYPPEPAVRRLAHVLHLHTPFRGTLAEPVPVLDLVARLHPTPAVGGTPTSAAMDWIARAEGGTRGWYAAPIGWLDAAGDGEFMVALRSALLDGRRALLYAGAGIVRDSDPAAELDETNVKLGTMRDALGVAW